MNHTSIRIIESLHASIENPSIQTKEIRECLYDCAASVDLLYSFREQRNKPPLNEDYLTDLDLVDYCIRREPMFFTIYKTCQVFSSCIKEIFIQTNVIQKGRLRSTGDDLETQRCILNNLQRGDFNKVLKLLEQSPWLVQTMKSLAPMHDQLIRPIIYDQLCLLDFMRLPAFGDGNPHYLLTLQALANHPAQPSEEKVINWIVGKSQGIDYHDQGWYSTMLMYLKELLQRNVLQQFLREKKLHQDLLYYGYGQDTPLNLKTFDDIYSKIFQNIYKGQNVSIMDGISDILEQKGIKQRNIKVYSKRVQLLLVGREVDVVLNDQDIIDQIRVIVIEVSEIKFEGINKSIGLQLLFEWANFAALFDRGMAQDIIRLSIEAIVIETRTSDCDSTTYQEKAFDLTLLLLKEVDDEEYVAQQLSEFMSTCKNISGLKGKVIESDFPQSIKVRFLDLLLRTSRYDYERVQQSIQMIHAMNLPVQHNNEKMISLLREVLAQCDEQFVVEAFKLVDLQIEPTKETIVYTEVIEMYTSLISEMKDDEVISKAIETIKKLVTLDGHDIIRQVQSTWAYRLLDGSILCCRSAQDRKLIFDFLQLLMVNQSMNKILNLKNILSILPIEEDDMFMKFIIQ